MKKKYILLLLLGFACIIMFFSIIHNRDQKVIKKNLNKLAMIMSRTPKENELVFVAKAARINDLFTKDCLIDVGSPIPKIEGLETLVGFFSQFQRMSDEISVAFYDISIILGEKHTAKAVMTVKAQGPDPQGGGSITDAREIEMVWRKIDGDWKIAEVRTIQTLH